MRTVSIKKSHRSKPSWQDEKGKGEMKEARGKGKGKGKGKDKGKGKGKGKLKRHGPRLRCSRQGIEDTLSWARTCLNGI